MTKPFALAMALSASCAPTHPLPVAVQVAYHNDDADIARVYELVDAAIGALGVDVEISRRGAIDLEIVQVVIGEPRGMAFRVDACHCVARANPRWQVIAHELGHCLGLEHVDDLSNVMHPGAAGGLIEDWQRDIMDQKIEEMGQCR